MTVIKVEKVNEVHLRVFCEDMGVEAELVEFFTFEVPGAKFMPKYRAKIWDGKKRLLDPIRKTLYVGLYPYIERFAEIHGYAVEYIDDSIKEEVSYSDIESFITNLNLTARGEPIEAREYQIDAVHRGITDERCVLLSPTGSGKSLIIYSTIRWHLMAGRKVIVVVPTTSLVEQMYSDFEDYSSHNGWNVDDHCQKLYSGLPKQFSKDVLFTTWQSAVNMPTQWFKQFDVLVGDECHQFAAMSLIKIMERLTHVKYKIGTTGSLDDKKLNRLVLEGLFGKIHRVTTTKNLQDIGQLSKLKINAILLKHSKETKVAYKPGKNKPTYQEEVAFLIGNEKRNKFIRNLALSCTGVTLVLYQFVEKQGAVLFDMIRQKNPNANVYYIHGGTSVEERESIRKAVAKSSNAIIVASVGTTSTGVNIPSISNIIFASPTKSTIRVLQSIGRGLRLNIGKTHCNLFDLTDDLCVGKVRNTTLEHGAERYRLYAAEQFSINLVEVNL